MADWEGLRREIEDGVTPPPLDALRARRARRTQRRAIAASSAFAMVAVASGVALLGQRAQRDASTAQVAAGTAIDRVALGDRLPPPRDYADYVVTDVDFVSAGTGWAIGLRCTGERCDVASWRTSDGGGSWGPAVMVAAQVPRASFTEQDPAGGGARSLRMVTETEGFAFNPDLYVTHDGARTWQRVRQPSKVAGVQVLGTSAWVFERGCPADDDCDAVVRTGTVGPGFALHDLRVPPTRGAPAAVRRETPTDGYLLTWDAPAGPRAALRRTYDGGRTWTDKVNPCPGATAELLSAGARRPLWVVCTTGADEARRTTAKQVWTSADGGTDWRRLADPPPAGVVTDLVALSSTTAYLTTQAPAALLVTTDGGGTWQPARGTAKSGYGYANLDVVDARHAWAMGDAGLLWRTTDGTTWERLTLPPGAPRASVVPSPSVGAAVPGGPVQVTGLSFPDARHGWALGRTCTETVCRLALRATDDGGVTWRTVPAPGGTYRPGVPGQRLDVTGVTFADQRTGWLTGDGGYVTHDAGRTWRPFGARLSDLHVVAGFVWALSHRACADGWCDPSVVRWPVGVDTVPPALVTYRGGPFVEAGLAVPDARHAFLVQTKGDKAAKVLTTADGGLVWRESAAPCDADTLARAVSAPAADDVWVLCGDEPATALQHHAVAHSSDGARTWRTAATGEAEGHVSALYAFSSSLAWRADGGVAGGLRVTQDGGRTWALATPGDGTGGPLAVAFADAAHGWALFPGGLWATTDGFLWAQVGAP